LEFGVSVAAALFLIDGFGYVFSILYCGSDLASSFNALSESEKNCGLPLLENRDQKLRKEQILMASVSLVNIWLLSIIPATISIWLIYFDISPNEEIFRFLLMKLNINNPYLWNFLSFIYLFIGLTEFVRLITLIAFFFLIVPLIMNSVMNTIHQQASRVSMVSKYNINFLKFYNEQRLIFNVMSTGIFTGGSIGFFVAMMTLIMLNFAIIRLNSALPKWILVCALLSSLILTITVYIVMSSFADLELNSTELIRICRNSSRMLVSKRYMHKTSLALRPVGFFVGIMGYNFRVVDRNMVKGYNVKIMDYTIVALLAIP
jgi:hypothetical protein